MLTEQITILVQRLAQDSDRRKVNIHAPLRAIDSPHPVYGGVGSRRLHPNRSDGNDARRFGAHGGADPAVVEAIQRVETVLDRANRSEVSTGPP